MRNLLEVQGISKEYPSFTLKNVSFQIPEGFIMGFIGPNGAGKTTTIKAILQMLAPTRGSIRIFGKEQSPDDVSYREDIGIVMDFPMYADVWTVKDVEAALSPFYKNWNKARYQSLCQKFSLPLASKVKDISRGMKVKLMVTVALSHDAKLLILDEPTSGLDPVARDELMEILQDFISDGSRSVLFSTHITSDLEKIADYITFIKKGEIIFTGEKDALMEQFVQVRGGNLPPDLHTHIIGLRQHGAGFDGMLHTDHLGLLPADSIAEPLSLDDIVIYMNKEGEDHD